MSSKPKAAKKVLMLSAPSGVLVSEHEPLEAKGPCVYGLLDRMTLLTQGTRFSESSFIFHQKDAGR